MASGKFKEGAVAGINPAARIDPRHKKRARPLLPGGGHRNHNHLGDRLRPDTTGKGEMARRSNHNARVNELCLGDWPDIFGSSVEGQRERRGGRTGRNFGCSNQMNRVAIVVAKIC